jgi:hypothetical protein
MTGWKPILREEGTVYGRSTSVAFFCADILNALPCGEMSISLLGDRMWNLPPPPGFQGLRVDKPLQMYQRHLPHWRQEGATYFVTFRLADALPQSKVSELAGLRKELERLHKLPWSNDVIEQYAREVINRVERWLDRGFGSCLLRTPALAALIVNAMHHFDLSTGPSVRVGE